MSISVSVDSGEGLERRMRVQVPAERIEKEIDTRLQTLSKKAKLKGFRPGKAPIHVIRKQYGAQVRQEVLSEVIQSSYSEAIGLEKLRPAGGPRIEAGTLEQGKDMEYTAIFEVYPEVVVKGLNKIKVERPTVEISESDVDNMLEKLRSQKATWEKVERAATAPDRVLIDFEGRVDGEIFDGGTASNTPVELGAGKMLKDFEAGLEGIQAGEQRSIAVQFPDDYHAPALVGKKAEFSIKAHHVEEQVLPEIDGVFCKEFGVEDGGIDALRKEVRENMARELSEAVRSKVKAQLMEGLLAQNQLEIPSALINEEIDVMQREMFGGEISDEKRSSLPRQPFEEQAKRRISLGLILGEIVRKEALEVDHERVRSKVLDMAGSYSEPEKMVRAYMSNPGMMRQVENMVLEEQAVDWLLEHTEVSEKSKTFKEVMDAA